MRPHKTRTIRGNPCGQSHWKAKLTDAQVRQMREAYAIGKAQSSMFGYGALASRFGCGISTARDIITGRTRFSAL